MRIETKGFARSSPRMFRMVALAAGVLLLAGTACASDDESTRTDVAPTTPPAVAGGLGLSDDQELGGYAGDFDTVTQGFRERSEDLQARVDTSTTDVDAILSFYGELRDIATDARKRYGAISAPSPVRSVHQEILQLFDRQVALLNELIEAGENDDEVGLTAAVQGLVDLTDEFDRARRAVQQAIAECGLPCLT